MYRYVYVHQPRDKGKRENARLVRISIRIITESIFYGRKVYCAVHSR